MVVFVLQLTAWLEGLEQTYSAFLTIIILFSPPPSQLTPPPLIPFRRKTGQAWELQIFPDVSSSSIWPLVILSLKS